MGTADNQQVPQKGRQVLLKESTLNHPACTLTSEAWPEACEEPLVVYSVQANRMRVYFYPNSDCHEQRRQATVAYASCRQYGYTCLYMHAYY